MPFADGSLLQQMRALSVEELLLPLLLQLALIIAVARLFAALFRRIGQPAVVGEITAGLLLGPSFLGHFFPGVFALIFRPALGELPPEAADLLISRVITSLAQIGLVLLLFLVGLEFDFSHLRWHSRTALAIALSGIVVPFTLGMALGWWLHPILGADTPRPGFVLFLGTAMSVTAIPVLGRMMVEMGVTRTPLAVVTIAAAAIDDAIGWILLATVAAGVHSTFNPVHTLGMVAATLSFSLFMLLVARPLLVVFARRALRAGDIHVNGLATLFVLLFLASAVTNLIGIFAIFGAFLLGAVLSSETAFREAVNRRLHDMVTTFFLPVFFAYTGMRTDLGALGSLPLWGFTVVVTVVAIVGKFGGCTLAALGSGLRLREASCVGVLMNTRGLMALVVINVGKDLGVIPDTMFCMLVLMALATTFMTTPLLLRLMRGTELEEPILASGFATRRRPTADAPAAEVAPGD